MRYFWLQGICPENWYPFTKNDMAFILEPAKDRAQLTLHNLSHQIAKPVKA